MKGLFTVLILALACSFSYSQKAYELSHQVLVPAASVEPVKDGISYQQTVGETAVEITLPDIYILTQGFQQPRFIPPVDYPVREGNGVDFFPNPVTETVDYMFNVRMYGVLGRHYYIIITNLPGAVLYTDEKEYSSVHNVILPVDLKKYAKGIYVIRVWSSDGVIDRSFKIDKL
ncbi:MAG: hypothetical protein WCD55_02265 [Bacteroidales bacterium]